MLREGTDGLVSDGVPSCANVRHELKMKVKGGLKSHRLKSASQ
eukprot:COSAG02_NODE_20586_length_824_cov_1.204138_1_plen_42_part_10